jgi:ribosome recycling factor
MAIKPLIADAKQRMHASVETVLRELASMRTGRASLSMLDGQPGGKPGHA